MKPNDWMSLGFIHAGCVLIWTKTHRSGLEAPENSYSVIVSSDQYSNYGQTGFWT
ncbi:hypothetical protein ACVLV4_001332 [Rathayibacter agropyri]